MDRLKELVRTPGFADGTCRLPSASLWRQSLMLFATQVLTSEHVDAQHILLMLPSGQLPEVRALLLERIGQHQEALR